jgi:hypothetical protein
MSVKTFNGPRGLRLTLNDRDAATPAIVEMKIRGANCSATFDCAIECGELISSDGEYRTITGDMINWLEQFQDQVAEAYNRARAGNPEYQ